MLFKQGTTHEEIRKEMRGGPGEVKMRDLCASEERPAKCRVFAEMTIEPGSGIGTHPHAGETEFYYILSGTATAVDDGKEVVMQKGDCLVTGKGASHSLMNNAQQTLVVLACVVLD